MAHRQTLGALPSGPMRVTVPRPTRKKQTVTLPVPPSANDRLTIAPDRNTGKHRAFLTSAARDYRKGVAQVLLFLKPVPAPRDVKVDVIWHMAPGDKGDLDNRLKCLLDCLKGSGYDDDSQVSELQVSRIRGQKNAKVVVTIEDLTPMYEAPKAV